MNIRTFKHSCHTTRDSEGSVNGKLIPIYNINDRWYKRGEEPQQVYLTSVRGGKIKGPHLHYIRRGLFTCIKGNVRIVVKTDKGYQTLYSGEDHEYQSVEIPAGCPAAMQALDEKEALVLNMPYPAWTPDMNDEHSDDFSDYDWHD